ncbi:HNH endonuclease [Streptomyces sp. NPDC056938]|uniref:HNH endonuclease n=1 Tax=Streptomyces sp. NPDC056938 TaxID=3345970 RepID=UPI0036407D95
MSNHRPPHLNSHRRRARKERLAARDGRQCYYCQRPFPELRQATIDHIVPVSLWRTWSASALVLACRSCNDAKADRLPLSLALLLCTTFPAPVHGTPGTRGGVTVLTSVTTAVTPSVTPPVGATVTAVHEAGALFTNRSIPDPLPLAVWRLLARLATANQSTYTATWNAHPIPAQSPPNLHESTAQATVRRPTNRPDCLRAPRLVRACSRPTGEAVPA